MHYKFNKLLKIADTFAKSFKTVLGLIFPLSYFLKISIQLNYLEISARYSKVHSLTKFVILNKTK